MSAAHQPRNYTVEAGKMRSGAWAVATVGASHYDLSVSGPNGFLRSFKGTVAPSGTRLEVQTSSDPKTNRLTLTMTNRSSVALTVDVLDKYSAKTDSDQLDASATVSKRRSLARFDGWDDFVVSVAYDNAFERQVAGHLETGHDSISDPAMGNVV
jgi:phospholipase C